MQNVKDMDIDNLYIKEIRVDKGLTLKRYRPRAYGRATPIRRGYSHIFIKFSWKITSREGKGKVGSEG